MDESHFTHGRPAGIRQHYFRDGSPAFELEFDASGQLIRELEFPNHYRSYRCETLYQQGSAWNTEYCYRNNGNLYAIIKRYDYQPREEKYFNYNGALIHHTRSDEDWVETIIIDSVQVQ